MRFKYTITTRAWHVRASTHNPWRTLVPADFLTMGNTSFGFFLAYIRSMQNARRIQAFEDVSSIINRAAIDRLSLNQRNRLEERARSIGQVMVDIEVQRQRRRLNQPLHIIDEPQMPAPAPRTRDRGSNINF